ncbi:hypothetical protein LA080_010025 [Diaporthe eres]|nr:hypothetical protein LA080_010025 [Diaporthe eres]
MADAIGLAASIIALIKTAFAIQELVRRTVALHRKAPEEITAIQAVVDELLSFISQKLMRQGRDSYQARCKAWLRQKNKVVALGDRLKEARQNVILALNTGLFSIELAFRSIFANTPGQYPVVMKAIKNTKETWTRFLWDLSSEPLKRAKRSYLRLTAYTSRHQKVVTSYSYLTMERQFESQLRSSDGVRQDSVLEAYSGS